MRARLIIATVITALTLMLGAAAHAHQTTTCISGLQTIPPAGTGTPVFYITTTGGGIWLYAETNSHVGLQTGGPTLLSTALEDRSQDDKCFNHNCIGSAGCPSVKSDTGIF